MGRIDRRTRGKIEDGELSDCEDWKSEGGVQ